MPIIIVEIDSIAQSDLADMMDEYSDGVYPWSKDVNRFRISWLKYIDGELDKVGKLTPETEIEYMAIDQINTHVGEIYLDQITEIVNQIIENETDALHDAIQKEITNYEV